MRNCAYVECVILPAIDQLETANGVNCDTRCELGSARRYLLRLNAENRKIDSMRMHVAAPTRPGAWAARLSGAPRLSKRRAPSTLARVHPLAALLLLFLAAAPAAAALDDVSADVRKALKLSGQGAAVAVVGVSSSTGQATLLAQGGWGAGWVGRERASSLGQGARRRSRGASEVGWEPGGRRGCSAARRGAKCGRDTGEASAPSATGLPLPPLTPPTAAFCNPSVDGPRRRRHAPRRLPDGRNPE